MMFDSNYYLPDWTPSHPGTVYLVGQQMSLCPGYFIPSAFSEAFYHQVPDTTRVVDGFCPAKISFYSKGNGFQYSHDAILIEDMTNLLDFGTIKFVSGILPTHKLKLTRLQYPADMLVVG